MYMCDFELALRPLLSAAVIVVFSAHRFVPRPIACFSDFAPRGRARPRGEKISRRVRVSGRGPPTADAR